MANYSETILLRETPYLHLHNGAGVPVNCGGKLDIIARNEQVQVLCRTCHEGWRFLFTIKEMK